MDVKSLLATEAYGFSGVNVTIPGRMQFGDPSGLLCQISKHS